MNIRIRHYDRGNIYFAIPLRTPGMKQVVFSCLILIGALLNLGAQDIHYSQFYNAPFNINPALTGVFGGDVRLAGNYRSQWSSVPVDYKTVTLAADMKFIRRTARSGFFSGGLVFNYDKAGYSRLHLLDLGLNVSYTQAFSQTTFGTVGAMGAFKQRGFDLEDLKFDSQFSEELGTYNPGLPIGEDFPSTSNAFFDFGVGLNLRIQALQRSALVDRLNKRSKVDIGVGLFHLNKPDQSFIEDAKVPLTMRISPYILGVLQLTKSADLILNGYAQLQKPYRQYAGMVGGRLHINRSLGRQLALQLGVGYRLNDRFGDAFIPGIEIHMNGWQAGFSYDVNISDFDVATDRRGGPEISLSYIIRKVRPLPKFKFCPLI